MKPLEPWEVRPWAPKHIPQDPPRGFVEDVLANGGHVEPVGVPDDAKRMELLRQWKATRRGTRRRETLAKALTGLTLKTEWWVFAHPGSDIPAAFLSRPWEGNNAV